MRYATPSLRVSHVAAAFIAAFSPFSPSLSAAPDIATLLTPYRLLHIAMLVTSAVSPGRLRSQGPGPWFSNHRQLRHLIPALPVLFIYNSGLLCRSFAMFPFMSLRRAEVCGRAQWGCGVAALQVMPFMSRRHEMAVPAGVKGRAHPRY